ncbi:condensin complex subunit 2-like isoform X1 [Bradysia coprophila]|uniref:condensin complex subunit 2-like isoform X1 n=1 Tax=Bradysia coprophila TaxID=38358 RepID=UPI00187DC6DE|nr:condensin complex subunit 2-like isoform X1 [Bradysia coprophila]
MTPTHIDTPIRRNAVGSTPMSNQFASPVFENDDEAERRASRARVSLANDSSIVQHKEGLDQCLKIFNDNKISKDNVWQMALIDHFRVLVDKHHKTLNSFQVVGSSLEASSKIYGIRVDSVHADVLRMSSGLIRQKIVDNQDDSVEQEVNQESDQPNPEEEQRPVRKKKRPNRVVSTVTKSKDSINAKLETTTETDAIFAKLNSTVENNNSAKKLLQYVLSSQSSELRLRMNYKLWNNIEASVNDLNGTDVFDSPVVELPEFNWNPTSTDVLRPQLAGYVISNTPAEDDGNEQPDTSIDKSVDQFNELHFDIDGQVEPIQNDGGFMDLGDMGDDDFESLTEDDQHAIKACRGLRRSTNIITDMTPDDASSNLEYSYRSLTEKFTRFWAGPSYWKFKVNRAGNALRNPIGGEKKKKTFKNKVEPIQFEAEANDAMFVSVDSRPAAKLRKANIYNRWDARRTKLPRDFKLERNRFLRYSYAPGLPFDIPSSGSPQTVESDVIDDNGHDIESDNFGMDFGMDHQEDDDNIANVVQHERTNVTVTEIGADFEGAPEQVTQIHVKFAKTAKVVDMKQLKNVCLNIIRKECTQTAAKPDLPSKSASLKEDYADGVASFYQLYKELPQKLTRNMKEALSPAVAFYSILHLANDNDFRLIKDEENGFLIRQIQSK